MENRRDFINNGIEFVRYLSEYDGHSDFHAEGDPRASMAALQEPFQRSQQRIGYHSQFCQNYFLLW